MVATGSTRADLSSRTVLLTEGWRPPTSLPLKWLCKGKRSVWRKKREKGLPFKAPNTWQNRSTKTTKTPVFIRGNHVLWNVCQLSKILYMKMRKTATFLENFFFSLSPGSRLLLEGRRYSEHLLQKFSGKLVYTLLPGGLGTEGLSPFLREECHFKSLKVVLRC